MKKRYVWIPFLMITMILCQALPALCEMNRSDIYTGAELLFKMPDDMEETGAEATASSNFRTFYSPNLCESLMTGAFANEQAAQDKLTTLFGEAVASAIVNEGFDSLAGYAAQWTSFVAGSGEGSAFVNAVVISYRQTLLFVSSIPLSSYRSDDNGETYSGIVYDQIDSLAIYDPDIRLTIAMDNDFTLAGQAPLANIVIDEEAEAFVITATAEITNVQLLGILSDEEGRLIPSNTLGTWEKLTAGQSLRIRAYFPEILPTLGISYTMAEGQNCLRLITDSKIDGTPLLLEE